MSLVYVFATLMYSNKMLLVPKMDSQALLSGICCEIPSFQET